MFRIGDIVKPQSSWAIHLVGADNRAEVISTPIDNTPSGCLVRVKWLEPCESHSSNVALWHCEHLTLATLEDNMLSYFQIGDQVVHRETGEFGHIIDIGRDLIDVHWPDQARYKTHRPDELETAETESRFYDMMED